MKTTSTDILVVGAGPVGMTTALFLARQGVRLQIVDCAHRPASHPYACLLHPRALRILDHLDLASEVIRHGQRIQKLAFYEQGTRRAELNLAATPEYPYVLALSQSVLEDLLEERLRRDHGILVEWNHRLSELETADDQVTAVIDKLEETSKGYSVPTWQWAVQRSQRTRAAFVVGADGRHSSVGQHLQLQPLPQAEEQRYETYEVIVDRPPPREIRVSFDGPLASVYWPLPGQRCRWSLQVSSEGPADHLDHETDAHYVLEAEAFDPERLRSITTTLRTRAAWFDAELEGLDWATTVAYRPGVARQLGQGRCWLAGDAAHQTGPIGMQNLNLGLAEAEELAGHLGRSLRDGFDPAALRRYGESFRTQAQQLLGEFGEGLPVAGATSNLRAYGKRILECLPATGDDLAQMAEQLGLRLPLAVRALAGQPA